MCAFACWLRDGPWCPITAEWPSFVSAPVTFAGWNNSLLFPGVESLSKETEQHLFIAPSSPHWVNTNSTGQKSSAVPTAQRQHIMVSVYVWGNRCKQISLTKTCFRIAIKFDGSKLWSRYSVCLGGPFPWLLLHRLSMKWDIPLKRPEIWEKIKS